MKTNFSLILLLLSGICLAQPEHISTEISQVIRPDYDTASHKIITKMFAKESDAAEWKEIYEHETLFKKFRDASLTKKEEYLRAEEAGRQLLADGKIPETMLPVAGNESQER
ncbi:hypothetical protein HYN48_07390 [Flavobacterium magnum]|uniref:Uncharacterized protein n=1 Tax=Flavobacterium magnum TaxID=2162713 RepID=A0A2S0RDA0_9FLAO|nr:hypothetical protein [Flavobacterium magnum]AWA29917.1 hypothetical protein HYN48_07390 [Flavobacterium magnum]